MVWQKREVVSHIVLGIILLWGITFIFLNFSAIQVFATINESDESIAIFYGSLHDKYLGEMLADESGKSVKYFNITAIQANESFVFKNDSVIAVWWINELPLPLDLSFLGDVINWKKVGRGIFVLNLYFHETPLQELYQLGINSYAPIVIPLNGSSQEQEIHILDNYASMFTLNQTTYTFMGSTGWVQLNNHITMVGEVTTNGIDPALAGLKSGIWLADNRVVVGSFSLDTNFEINESIFDFKIQSLKLETSDTFVDTLAQIAKLSIGYLPPKGGFLQVININQLFTIGAFLATGLISFFLLIKTGVLTKVREILMSIFTSLFLVIAHIAYSPQKRRIDQDQLLDNELRAQILEYLEQKGSQGAHLREIQRELECGISSLLWHLQALDDFNLVTHEKIGKYHIFYLMGEKSIHESEMALALKSDVAKELCRVLIRKKEPLSLSEISQEIDAHHSSVQHHVKKLAELGIIIIVKKKKRSLYIIGSSKLPQLKELLEVA